MAEDLKRNQSISLRESIRMIRRWIHFLFSYFKIILAVAIVGVVVGFFYNDFIKPNYTAATTFVIEEKGGTFGGALGQYAGLAAMAGIDLGGGGNNLFQGDNILELYKSRTMLKKTLLSPLQTEGTSDLLINRYIEFNDLRDKWDGKEELRGINFTIAPEKYTVKHDSLINLILKRITKTSLRVEKQDKKLSIIKVSFESKDELFAKAFVEKLVDNVNALYKMTKTKKSLENVTVLQRQTDSVRRELNAAITGVAVSADVNPNPNPARQVLRVPGQKKTVDVQANSAILEELVKHLELSKLTLRNDEPLIQIIDKPVLPLENDKVGRLKGAVIGGFIFGLITLLVLTFKYLIDD